MDTVKNQEKKSYRYELPHIQGNISAHEVQPSKTTRTRCTRFTRVMTKLNLVNLVRLSPTLSRAFSFWYAQVNHSSLILGGLDHREGGNRYQGSLLILTSCNQV